MKIKIRVTAVVLLVVLLILTFVSRSIYDYNIPRVWTAVLIKDKVTRSVDAVGTIIYLNATEVKAAGAWTLTGVNVKDGDIVSAGEILCTFDTRASDVSLQGLRINLLQAQNTFEQVSEQAAAGQSSDGAKELAEAQVNFAQSQLDLATELAPPADGLTAPCSGTVYGMTLKAGDTAGANAVILSIISDGASPVLTFTLPSDIGADYTAATVQAKIETEKSDLFGYVSYAREAASGTVMKAVLKGGSWEFEVYLGKLVGLPVAEQEVPLTASMTGDTELVVPIGSLFSDGNGGKCIYMIEQRPGMFGRESYVTQQNVNVKYDNGMEAAIENSGGITEGLIANAPSRPLTDGAAVWVNN